MNEEHVELVSAFGEFCDVPESPFYCSKGLSPAETWNRSVTAMAELLLELPELVGSPGFSISPDLLCAWHEHIFGALFPDQAGRLRWRREGEWEQVFFGGNIGTTRSRRFKEYRGTHPKRLRQRMQRICDEFNEAGHELRKAEPGRTPIDEASNACARLYVKLLRAHPWVDGNLRAAFIALQAALWWLDLPGVKFLDLEQHDDMVGIAFRGDHEPYRQLAEYIANRIHTQYVK